jgi:hypothetical protein
MLGIYVIKSTGISIWIYSRSPHWLQYMESATFSLPHLEQRFGSGFSSAC